MRLIDADALKKKLEKYEPMLSTLSSFEFVTKEDIDEMPTVCDIEQIRKEIQKPMRKTMIVDTETQKAQMLALAWCLEIIDKYTKGDTE